MKRHQAALLSGRGFFTRMVTMLSKEDRAYFARLIRARKKRESDRASRGPCKHCGKRAASRSRGLCTPCFETMDIRAQYPLMTDRYPEPTEEELEAIIAEQMRNLPDWWYRKDQK